MTVFSTKPMYWLAIPSLVASVFAAGYWLHQHDVLTSAQATAPATRQQMTAPSSYITLPNFASIASSQGAAVVNISVSGSVKAQAMPGLDPNDPMFEFFKRFQPNLPSPETPVSGMGSGFIVKSDGVILTNAHVVDHADEVVVKLADRREFKATVLGVDKPTDIAVLKIAAKDLPTVKIGNAQQSQVGDWVVAIGAPFGFENSVTAGIISAKSRALPDEGYVPFLQTDVAINPGNSGGPLFNLNGEVIGVNSQIYSRSGGYQGLSFAIPIEVAMGIEQQLLTSGKVSRGRIGVSIQPINQDLASSFGLSSPNGALVSSVEKAGPAEQAGLQAGDVIVAFNGQAIERSSDLPPLVANVTPGSAATVEVLRNKQRKTLRVKVAALESANTVVATRAHSQQAKLGVSVRPLSAQEMAQAQLSQGLLVEQVARGPAANAGIQAGDVILAINGDPLHAVDDLRQALHQKSKSVALLVMRGDSKLYVPVKLG